MNLFFKGANSWDNGYPSGGNYWSNYVVVDYYSGPYQNETRSDGIGDVSYIIDVNNRDRYPLMKPWGPIANRPPVVKFDVMPKNPALEEKIIFDASSSYDLDGSIVRYEWDFGDGNTISANQSKVSHTYLETGSFVITLRVTDNQGASSSAQTSVTVKRFWSFAIITDIHIGYGIPDFGEENYKNDGDGEDYWLTTRLKSTVEKIKSLNADNTKDYYIRFVVALGDIVDTAEESEFKKAKEILDRLNDAGIPYIPIFGNHEAWPYSEPPQPFLGIIRVTASQAPSPIGDQYFEKYFFRWDNKNMDLIKKLFGGSWKKMSNPAG
ncbi:PKD domain-containing protein, partial [Candidatus Bathyarchaeota archaeon]|nr:PKD domain-containing protein [Candidatus Bathyarchaeota archaeon]